MSVTRLAQKEQTKQEFIGKAWVNKAKQGKHEGTEYLNVTFDKNISEVVIKATDRLLIWPNEKREGVNPKTNKPYMDADFRVSLVSAA
jgi:hypothetical protein